MTTIKIDRTRRAALKRLFKGGRHFILVNENGDLTDLETHVRFDPEAPIGTWHSIYTYDHRKELFTAEEYTVTDTSVTIRAGNATRILETETQSAGDNPIRVALDGPRLTIKSADGHNHAAFALLAATADDDETLPILTGARLLGDSSGDVTAASTDRYVATFAKLTAETADVNAILPRTLLRELAHRKEWTITATDPATTIAFHDIGITVTSGNTEGSYPTVEKHFPDDRSNFNTVTAKPKRITDAIKSLAVPQREIAMLTTAGTVFAEDTPEVPIEDATSAEDDDCYAPLLGINPRHILRMTRAAGAKWDTVIMSWGSAFKPIYLDWGHGITGLSMPTRSHLPHPEAAPVAEAEPEAESVAVGA